MISAPGEPPGSRVKSVAMPNDLIREASSAARVDLPAPSPPSNVMKRPRICESSESLGRRAKHVDHKFRSCVEGVLRHRAHSNALAGLQRRLQHLGVAARHQELADRLALAP